MQIFIVLAILFAIKIIQLININILGIYLEGEAGKTAIIGILGIAVILLSALYLLEKYAPSMLKGRWPAIFLALTVYIFGVSGLPDLIGTGRIGPFDLGIYKDNSVYIVLSGIILFGLIAAESRMIRTISESFKINKGIIFLAAIIPVALIYFIPEKISLISQFFYITSTLIALIFSYLLELNTGWGSAIRNKLIQLIAGLAFIAIWEITYFTYSSRLAADDSMMIYGTITIFTINAVMVYEAIESLVRERWNS